MSILQDLYEGRIFPFEEIKDRTAKHQGIIDEIKSETAYFLEKLSPEDGKRFEEFCSLYLEDSSMYGYASFLYGVRLGISIMFEALSDR